MISIQATAYQGRPASEPLVADFGEAGGTIGRRDGNTLVLPDPERHISRVHAVIECRAGAYVIRDQGTATPVFVNRQALGNGREAAIDDGDEIGIGGYTLRVSVKRHRVAPINPSPQSADDPFADLLPPVPASTYTASAARGAIDDPFAAHAILPNNAASQAIPEDFDPFADLIPASQQSGALQLPADIDLGFGAAGGANLGLNQSIDALFGLDNSSAANPLATDFAAQPNSSGIATDAMSLDPLAAFGGAQAAGPTFGSTQRNDTSELRGSLRLPPIKPELPQSSTAPQQPTPIVAQDMLLSWEESDGKQPAGVQTVIIGTERRATPSSVNSAAQALDPLALFGGESTAADPLALHAAVATANTPPKTDIPTATANNSTHSTAAVQASVTAPAPAPAQQTPAARDQLLQALLEGAGVPDLDMPGGLTPQLMTMIGKLLRESTQGTLDLLLARALTKREVRADVTMIVGQENNPLKFSPTVEVALSHLLAPQGRGFLTPLRAIKGAYNDLRAHQLGFMAGMQAALSGVLARFSPARLEKRLQQKTLVDSLLPMNRRAKLWDLFSELYGDISSEAEDDFHALFGKEFLRAYEEQIAKLQQQDEKARH